MEYPLISIIVPVYNVEKYLYRCLDSIVAQDYPNYEVILVDDGSTDHSGEMCDSYANNRKNIRVIHQDNAGLSAARNTGINHAKGNLIGFVDSDDYIDKDMYSHLYNNLIEHGCDLAICSMYDCYPGKSPYIHEEKTIQVISPKEAIIIGFDEGFSIINAVNKLYKKELFATVMFPQGKTFEDAFVFADVVLSCKRIVFSTAQKYYYMHREDSITSKPFSKKSFDVIEAYEYNYKIIVNRIPEIEDSAFGRIAWAYGYVLDQLEAAPDKDKYIKEESVLLSFVKKNFGRILRNKKLSLKRRIAFIVVLFNKKLYKKLVMNKTSPFNLK